MITETDAKTERVTAVLTSHIETGENFEGSIVFGFYPENTSEVFVLSQGTRMGIQVADVDDFCKQLKRAKKLALEQT